MSKNEQRTAQLTQFQPNRSNEETVLQDEVEPQGENRNMWKKPIVLLITLLLAILGVTAVQVAANNAGPGDEIVVGEGSYSESVNVNNMGSVGQTQAVGAEAAGATRLSDLPLALQYTVSEAMGRNQSAYHPERQPNGFRAATPAQGYTTHFGVEGMTLTVGQSRLQMQLTGVGYGERLTAVAAALPTSSDNRVEYRRGNVTEWYVNGPLGLQQGFTLEERPAPTGCGKRYCRRAIPDPGPGRWWRLAGRGVCWRARPEPDRRRRRLPMLRRPAGARCQRARTARLLHPQPEIYNR